MTSRSRAISANGLRLAMLRGAQACTPHRHPWRRRRADSRPVPSPPRCARAAASAAASSRHPTGQPGAGSACGDTRSPPHGTAGPPGPGTRKACGAERERRHRGRRAVIGNAVDDAEPRSAPRAVGKAIAVASLRRIEHFARAFGTDRGIGSDLGTRRAGDTIDDAEARRARPAERLRSIRSIWASGGGSRRIRSSSAAIAPPPPATRISTPSASFRTSPDRPSSRRHPPDGGPKPHALHAPSNPDLRHFHSDATPQPDRRT